MTIPQDYLTLGIFGRSGSGKSSLLKEALRGETRVIAFDPMLDLTGPGWKSMSGQVAPVAREALKTRVKVSYHPAKGVNAVKALNALSGAILDVQAGFRSGKHKHKILFVVEEMAKSFPLHAGKDAPNFVEICDRGRHYGIRLCGVSQGVNKTGIDFRDRLDAVCVLAQMRKGACEVAADLIGEDWRTVRELENFQYLAYHNGTLTRGATKK